MDKMDIYYKLPIFAQNMACYIEGNKILKNRYGQEFWRYLDEYENRKHWKYEQLCDYRDTKLRKMIKHCYDTVPYYTRLFNDLGVDYRSIRTVDGLSVLPILTKRTIRERFDEFISSAIDKKKMVMAHTGGTTGSGFEFYTTNIQMSEQWAVWWKYRRNLGITTDIWCGLFGGKAIVPKTQVNPPFWRMNKPCKQVYFSEYHINKNNYMHYVNMLRDKKITWLHGYPSNINSLAAYMVEDGVQLKMDYLTIGSENLLEHQIFTIEKAFCVKPSQHYGAAEGVANISQSVNNELYVDEDFAAVEFVENPIWEGYRLIGTTLTNFAMPFLRFDTGDLVAAVKIPHASDCGGRIVKGILGREGDFLILKDGEKVGEAACSLFFKEIPSILEAQLIQTTIDSITVKAVVSKLYSTVDENKLRYHMQRVLGHNLQISYAYVNSLEKTKSGKQKFIIQKTNM